MPRPSRPRASRAWRSPTRCPTGAPAPPITKGPPRTQLLKTDIKEGTGAVVGANDDVTVNYMGVSCSTGKIFDSSYGRGSRRPSPRRRDQGLEHGIPGMKVGGQRLLGIPSELGYGPSGSPPDIAPDEYLWFVIEATATKPPAATTGTTPVGTTPVGTAATTATTAKP